MNSIITPPLDPGFVPMALVNRDYQQKVAEAGSPQPLGIALERESGLVSRHDLQLLPAGLEDALTQRIAERHIKFLLWSQGGFRLHLAGAASLCSHLKTIFSAAGERAFDAGIMYKVYGETLEVVVHADMAELPAQKSQAMSIGGHLDGCRIGFDLGASDFKIAAVQDGEAVFSMELPWDPVKQTDPGYHYHRINCGLDLAASKLPRVDAIGGSSAGIYVSNQPRVASLFRGISPQQFTSCIKPMFERIRTERGVPLVVVNDGDVTALAGAMSLETTNLLGIAMGSSEAVGYINPAGQITGYLNELAFAPVDFNPQAVADEWSGDGGVGALYFSQQAVNKLAPAAGYQFEAALALPERLKRVQADANAGKPEALQIFETIGVYLGYSLLHYHDYYGFDHVLLLGRVTSGRGGELVLETATRTLQAIQPALAEQIGIHVPDERSRRVGQAVAAASLPEVAS